MRRRRAYQAAMNVTGYQLREQVKQLTLRLDLLRPQFDDASTAFEGETKPGLSVLAEQITEIEDNLVSVQEAQQRYNLAVTQTIGGRTYTLCALVKLIGAAGRREKTWRELTKPPKRDSYREESHNVRDPTKLYAKRTITPDEAGKLATQAARFASDIRAAIATGNALVVDIAVDPRLFK